MKRIIIGILMVAMLIGGASHITAQISQPETETNLFEAGVQHMRRFHNSLTTQEREEMFETCHGNNEAQPRHMRQRGRQAFLDESEQSTEN